MHVHGILNSIAMHDSEKKLAMHVFDPYRQVLGIYLLKKGHAW